MAGRKAAKQAAPKLEEDDDTEGWEDAVVETESEKEADLRMRDWRDVERYREMKELRRLVDDDYGLAEIFQIPARRAAAGTGKLAKTPPPKGAVAKPANAAKGQHPVPAKTQHAAPAKAHPAAPAKAVPAKPPIKVVVAKTAPRKLPARHASSARLKAKAKRK